jgi:6-phosphogluconolactonase
MTYKHPIEVIIEKEPDCLALRAAEFIAHAAQDSIGRQGRFSLVLTGGSTPSVTYMKLSEPRFADMVEWPNSFVFLSDERYVPLNDPLSNLNMIEHNLLSRIKIPPANVYPINTENKSITEAAAAYANRIAEFFGITDRTVTPRFDLILLGMGEDGHIASLFPHSPELDEKDAWITCSHPGTLPPQVERITFTYRLLNAARHIAFIVTGEKKAAALSEVLEGHASKQDRPAAGIRPLDGKVSWFIDQEAAGLLKKCGTRSLTARG